MEIFFVLLVVFVFIVILAKNDSETNNNTPSYKQTVYTSPQASGSSNYDDEYTSPYLYKNIKVVGGFYRSYDAKKVLRSLGIGDYVYFKEEPTNPYDKNAIMVISEDGYHIGYIPRDTTYLIKRRMDIEFVAGFVSEVTDGRYEFYIDVVELADSSEHYKVLERYDNLLVEKMVAESSGGSDGYTDAETAMKLYLMGRHDSAESILMPYVNNGKMTYSGYIVMIFLMHRKKDYELEEKLIDSFLKFSNITDKDRMMMKRRKYHILRQMGIIVDDEQIENEKAGIETTVRELDGFAVVEDILREYVDVNKLDYRDSKTVFSINVDDNRNKPICKLYMNNPNKMYIGLIEDKVVKYPISNVEDIRKYSQQLKDTLMKYA